MSSLIRERTEKKTCPQCKRDFIVVWQYLPSKMDDKRESYYCCPYCKHATSVYLLADEEVETREIQ